MDNHVPTLRSCSTCTAIIFLPQHCQLAYILHGGMPCHCYLHVYCCIRYECLVLNRVYAALVPACKYMVQFRYCMYVSCILVRLQPCSSDTMYVSCILVWSHPYSPDITCSGAHSKLLVLSPALQHTCTELCSGYVVHVYRYNCMENIHCTTVQNISWSSSWPSLWPATGLASYPQRKRYLPPTGYAALATTQWKVAGIRTPHDHRTAFVYESVER